MLPSDFSSERQARQRYLKREADMRGDNLHEAKVKVSTTAPVWVVEVQFERADYDNEQIGSTMTNSFVDTFMGLVQQARLGVEERVRENRSFVQVPARTSKEAEKVVKDLLAKAIKIQRDSRLQSRGRR